MANSVRIVREWPLTEVPHVTAPRMVFELHMDGSLSASTIQALRESFFWLDRLASLARKDLGR